MCSLSTSYEVRRTCTTGTSATSCRRVGFVGGRHATGQRFDGMPEPPSVAFEENLVSLLDEVGLVEAGLPGEGREEVAPGDADGDAVGGHELAADHDVVALGDTEAGSDMGCGGL